MATVPVVTRKVILGIYEVASLTTGVDWSPFSINESLDVVVFVLFGKLSCTVKGVKTSGSISNSFKVCFGSLNLALKLVVSVYCLVF